MTIPELRTDSLLIPGDPFFRPAKKATPAPVARTPVQRKTTKAKIVHTCQKCGAEAPTKDEPCIICLELEEAKLAKSAERQRLEDLARKKQARDAVIAVAESTRGQTPHALAPASASSESQSAAAEAVAARFDPAVIGIGELDESFGKVYVYKGKTYREK